LGENLAKQQFSALARRNCITASENCSKDEAQFAPLLVVYAIASFQNRGCSASAAADTSSSAPYLHCTTDKLNEFPNLSNSPNTPFCATVSPLTRHSR
jgi:hypothetical protein